jgi:hypothetical protein
MVEHLLSKHEAPSPNPERERRAGRRGGGGEKGGKGGGEQLHLILDSKLLLFLGNHKPLTLLFEDNFQKLIYLDNSLSATQKRLQ